MFSIRSKGRQLSTAIDPFAAGPSLEALREKFGDSEFGYRVQALLGSTLASLGAQILEINAQGHPDIKAVWQGQTLLIQVKSLHHQFPEHRYTLSSEDLRGITPQAKGDVGYLALLDCASPAEWIFIQEDSVRGHLGRPIHTVTLRADSDRSLSLLCSQEFLRVIVAYKDRLPDMTYALLRKRALGATKT